MMFTSPTPFTGSFACPFPSSSHQPNPWYGSSFNPVGSNWPGFSPSFGSIPGGSNCDSWNNTSPFSASPWSQGSTFNPAAFNGPVGAHPGITNPAWFGVPSTPWFGTQPNWNNHNWSGAGSWVGTPSFNQPWFGTPNYNYPGFGTPNFNQPFGFSHSTPWFGTSFGAPIGWPSPFNWTNHQPQVNWPQPGTSGPGPANTGFSNPASYSSQPTPNQGPGVNCEAA